MNERDHIEMVRREAGGMFIYFSQLMDRPVVDIGGHPAGKLHDIVVRPTEVYPPSQALIISEGFLPRKYALAPWSDVADVDHRGVRLKIEQWRLQFRREHDHREEFTIRRDVLDQQVVDTHDQKVIRVNDIHLLKVDCCLTVVHVDISLRGLLRRLGLEEAADLLVRLLNRNASYLQAEPLVSWKHIQPLAINPVSMTIKINLPHGELSHIAPADLGEIFMGLKIRHQIALFKLLDLSTKARVFAGLDFRIQKSLTEDMAPKEVAEILGAEAPDEAADFLERMPKAMREALLALMESKQAHKLGQLLGYSKDSAGGLMTTEYLAFPTGTTVESALQQIRSRPLKAEISPAVYIIDDTGHLLGATTLRRMISAEPQEPIDKSAFRKTHFVHLDSSTKEVAYMMEKYRYYAIPVVNEENALQGIITADDILSQVISIAWRRLRRIQPTRTP